MERQYKRTEDYLQPIKLTPVDEDLLVLFYKMNNLEDSIEDMFYSERGIVSEAWDDNLLNTAVEIRDFILMMLEGRLGIHSLEDFYNSGEIIHYNRKGTPLTYLVNND